MTDLPPPPRPAPAAPEPPNRGSAKKWIIGAVAVALAIGLGITGFIALGDSDGQEDPDPTAEGGDDREIPDQDPELNPENQDPDETDDEAPEADGSTGVADQASELLDTIDESELRMIQFQIEASEHLGADGEVGDGAEEIAQLASQTGEDLVAIRGELREVASEDGSEFAGLRAIRDSYVAHMDAWISYVDAVHGRPALYAAEEGGDADPYWQEIEETADVFVDDVTVELPEDLPQELYQLAQLIVERGFSGLHGPGTGQFA